MDPQDAGIAGLVLHALAGAVLLVLAARTAPAWAALALGVWWLALAAVAVNTFHHTPELTPVVPLIAVVVWTGVVAIGHRFLAWA